MKKIIILSVFLKSISGFTQNPQTLSLSLAKSLEMGIQNRYDAQANKINIAIANNATEKYKKEWLPDISASGNIKYNTQLQTMVFDGFGGGNTKITVGTKNFTNFALDLTQNIYKPGLTTDIKIAQTTSLLEQEKNNEKDISIKQSIAEAYLNVILKKIQLKLANENVERNSQYFMMAEEKYRLKVLLDNDLLKTKLDYENAKITTLESKQNYELAIMKLKYQLNIDNTSQITLTDSIETFQKETITINTDLSNIERTELKQLALQYKINKLNIIKGNQYFLPTLSLTGNYTTQFQAENYDYSQNIWSPFNYIGLKINMPLTGNLKNINTIKDFRFKMTQNELQLKQKQQDINNEISKNKTELANAENAIIANKNNLLLSNTVYVNQLNMYKLGTVSYSSILDTEKSVNTAEQNYMNAVYNFLLSKVNYEKSIGKL